MANPTWQKLNTALLPLLSSPPNFNIWLNSRTLRQKAARPIQNQSIHRENKSICRVIITRDSKPHHIHPSLTYTQRINPHLPTARFGHLTWSEVFPAVVNHQQLCTTPAQPFFFHPSWMIFIIEVITFTAWFFKCLGILESYAEKQHLSQKMKEVKGSYELQQIKWASALTSVMLIWIFFHLQDWIPIIILSQTFTDLAK